MDWKKIFDLHDINWWTLLAGMGANYALVSFLFLGITFAESQGMAPALYTLLMLGGGFLIPLLTAYICGRLTEERYMTYCLYSLVGYLLLIAPGVLRSGLPGLFMVFFGLMGALNGSHLAAMRASRRRHAIQDTEPPRRGPSRS